MNQPLVTVAIPLHRSKAFLHGLHGNCEALAAEGDIEIVVSDRHGLDDAVNILESQWRSDPRFRFFKAKDRLNWVEHMNLLLAEARGRYFRWLPHDDLVPAGCLRPLVERLQCDPRVMLAYAPPRAIDAAGRRMPARDRFNTSPVPPGHAWTMRHSLDLFWNNSCGGAFKGLFRREPVVNAGLFIRPTYELVFSERAWLFGISLLGELAEEPESVYMKRFHPDSVTAHWRRGARHVMSTTATMCGYLRDFGPDRRTKCYGTAYLWARALGRLGGFS